MKSTQRPMGGRTRGKKQRNRRITTEVVPDDALAAIRASSEVLRRRQREHQLLGLGDGARGVSVSVRVRPEELPQSSARWLEQCGATLADLIRWLDDMPYCDCPSLDVISWPQAQASVFDGTPFGTRVRGSRTALAELHARVVQPLIDAGRLTPPTGFTLERLIWARGKQLHSAPPAALSTSVRLWCGLPLVGDNPLDTYEVFVSAAFPLTCEAEASLLRVRLGHLENAEGIAGVDCEQISLEDGRPGARVRAGPFVLRRQNSVSYFSSAIPSAISDATQVIPQKHIVLCIVVWRRLPAVFLPRCYGASPALPWKNKKTPLLLSTRAMHASVSVDIYDFPSVCCKRDKECSGIVAFLKRALCDLSATAATDAATLEAAQLLLNEHAPEATGQALQISVEERAAVGLALYRSGARAALEAAISATQAMVDDSAPLPEAHTAVRSVSFSAKSLSTAKVAFMRLLCLCGTRVGVHQ